MSDEKKLKRPVIQLPPQGGRPYVLGELGDVTAVFKADGDETARQYSIAEWTFQPHAKGSGVHTHEDDDVFYVLEGTLSVRIEDDWVEAQTGAMVLIPGGVRHDFENRSASVVRVLNFSAPGTFEEKMPKLTEHYLSRPKLEVKW